MKKPFICFSLVLIVTLLLPLPVFANSAPISDDGTQGAELLTLDEDTPIVVDHESLLFDYRTLEENTSDGGRVTASYDMRNPTDRELSVKMAFPYVSPPHAVRAEDILITCEGEPLPWEYYASKSRIHRSDLDAAFVESQLDITQILETIDHGNQPYRPKHYNLDAKGTLYLFSNLQEPGNNQSLSLVTDKESLSGCILKNLIVRPSEGSKTTCESISLAEESTIFSTKGPIHFTTSGPFEVTTLEMTLEGYMEKFNSEFWTSEIPAADQLRNNWLKALDDDFSGPEGYAHNTLAHYKSDENVAVNLLVYEVIFPPHGNLEVSVSYPASPYVDGVFQPFGAPKAIYQDVYLLNPARHWAAFHSLDVTIYTPSFAPHLISSNLPFTQSTTQAYTASFSELPSEDLTFSFYSGPHPPGFFIIPTLIIVLSAVVLLIVILILLHRRKVKRNPPPPPILIGGSYPPLSGPPPGAGS